MNQSMVALTWAMSARGLSPTAWVILFQLCNRVNNERGDFDVWPSHQTIAEDVGISQSTVKRHIAELVEQGYVVVIQQRRGDGGRSSNRYRLQVKVQQHMPRGRTETVDCDDLGARSTVNGGPGQSDLAPQVTADLAEPNQERTYPIEDSPLPPEGAGGAGEVDLFGLPIVDAVAEFEAAVVSRFEERWTQHAQRFPRVAGLRLPMSDRKRTALLARVREWYSGTVVQEGINVVDTLMARIEGSPFLCGEVKDWAAPVDWVLGPENFEKTMERRDERQLASNDSPFGQGSSAVRAGQRALEMLRDSRERSAARSGNAPGRN